MQNIGSDFWPVKENSATGIGTTVIIFWGTVGEGYANNKFNGTPGFAFIRFQQPVFRNNRNQAHYYFFMAPLM